MKVFSANDFKSVAAGLSQKKSWEESNVPITPVNPLNGQSSSLAQSQPMKSSIVDYELLMQSKN